MGLKLENNTYHLDISAVLRTVSNGRNEPLHAHDFVELTSPSHSFPFLIPLTILR